MVLGHSLLWAYGAKHIQLLLVFSTHAFFLSVVLWKQECFLVLRPLPIEFFRNLLGLKLTASRKESREQLASKLVTLIEKLPDHKKSEVISDLLKGRNNQTQGWIDVTKSTKQ